MRFNKHIHDYPHLIKSLLGSLPLSKPKTEGDLLVLNFHGTPLKFMNNFKNIIQYLESRYEIISPDTFFKNIITSEENTKSKILLTFDDGLKNNLYALEHLNSKNISALLFVVPNFIDASDPQSYYLSYIRPTVNPFIDSEKEDFTPLNWDEISTICKKHHIGSHSLSHTMTREILNESLMFNEVVKSKNILQSKLGKEINSFCSINNTLESINKISKDLIKEHYSYHFTTFPGNNLTHKNPQLIKRINIESYWLLNAVKFSLTAINFNRFTEKINQYNLI